MGAALLRPLDLRLFATIVDLGGISAAARSLGLPKSSVSRDLAAIEARLGARLLQRTTRRLSLTEAGEVLISYARRVAEEIENAEAAVESLSESPRGHLAVTAPYAFVRSVLVPFLPVFRMRHPELRLSIMPTIKVIDLIDERIDVAIRIGELDASTLVARKLGEVALVLVASKAYAATHGLPGEIGELESHCLIDLSTRADATAWTLTDRNGARKTVAVQPRLAIGEPSILLDLVEQGFGIGIVPKLYADAAIRSGAVIPVLPGAHRGIRPVHAIYPSRRLIAPKVTAFIEFATDCLHKVSLRSDPG